MSTSAQLFPVWKQEVNRRVAEHRNRKGASAAELAASAPDSHAPSRRAQEAAARVAARYANAPSYSEMLAGEARAALRAAEAASRAALEAQAAAQLVLDGMAAANAAASAAQEPLYTPDLDPRVADSAESPFSDPFFAPQTDARKAARSRRRMETSASEANEVAGPSNESALALTHQPSSIGWENDLPALSTQPVRTRATLGQDRFETGREGWWRPAAVEPEAEQDSAGAEGIEIVEPVSIPANLIEFPRELVAPRKARPRLTAAPHSAVPAVMQLSIFEVDPIELPSEPATEAIPGAAQAQTVQSQTTQTQSVQSWTAQSWTAQAWTAQARAASAWPEMLDVESACARPTADAQAGQHADSAPALEPAPATLRLLAMVTDAAIVTGSLLAAALLAASRVRVLPGVRAAEIGMGVALIVAAAFYQVLFFTLGRATPGMKYARLRLTTFDGCLPARAERCRRLGALLVSALPAGLGMVWALFDENHLSWHDRLSQTYLCKR